MTAEARHEIGPLAGVIVWTSSARFSELRHFYLNTLGLSPRSDRPSRVTFDWGGMRLTLGIHDGVEGVNLHPERIMINFTTGDLDATHRRLTAAGVRCLRPPDREVWGGRVATYLDPDDNILQLLELAPISSGLP